MDALKLIPSLGSATRSTSNAQAGDGGQFAELLQGLIRKTTQAQGKAESLTLAATQGQEIPLHEVVQAITEAQLTLQTLTSVRDRAVEAYQEIIRMPI
jgi:flagellar hook-basal body complex protein FliE